MQADLLEHVSDFCVWSAAWGRVLVLRIVSSLNASCPPSRVQPRCRRCPRGGTDYALASAMLAFKTVRPLGLILRSFGDGRLDIAAWCARPQCLPPVNRVSRASGIAVGRKPCRRPTFLAAFPKINGVGPIHSIFVCWVILVCWVMPSPHFIDCADGLNRQDARNSPLTSRLLPDPDNGVATSS